MLDNFRFETFVDVHSNIFAEYLSSVIAKLPKENPEYRSTEERIEELYARLTCYRYFEGTVAERLQNR